MDLIQQLGVEAVHFLGLLLLGAISALIVLWRDHGRVSDRLNALEKDWEKERDLLHARISDHERERKQEFKDLRDDVAQLRSEFREMRGMLEVWTQSWSRKGDA